VEERLDAHVRISSLVVLALLCALTLALAYEGGGYGPATWLPFSIGVAALAVVLATSAPTLTADRLQKVILALFAAQTAWTFASLLWASSTANAWEEANRTIFYALVIALTFAAMRWGRRIALTWLPVLLLAVTVIVAVVTFLMIWLKSEPAQLLSDGRLSYPVTYTNGLASFLIIGFWLALGLANATHRRASRRQATPAGPGTGPVHRFRWWMQPIFLAMGVFLVTISLLCQSRGALWILCLVVPFFFILSPHRVRAFVNLGIVLLPVILFWGKWSAAYSAVSAGNPAGPPLDGALRAMGYSVLIVLVLWLVTWLVEQRIGELPGRAGFWVGVALGVLVLLSCVGGIAYADQRSGGLAGYVQNRWEEFVSDESGSVETGSRLGAFGLDGRLGVWRVAVDSFAENPVLGLGAQNFEIYYGQHRTTVEDMRQPHSQPLQLLSELGLPGLLLYVGFFVLVVARTLILRFGAAGRRAGRTNNALLAAMATALLSWFVHSSVDWLWQLAAVTVPAMVLLGGLAGVDATYTEQTGGRAPGRPRRLRRLVRPVLAMLAVLAIVSAGLPYLSSRFAESASAAISVDPQSALERANTAASLDPTSTAPYVIRAGVHASAAAEAPEGSPGRALELTLAARAWDDATRVEPEGWLYHFQAARAYQDAGNAARLAGGSQVDAAQELDAKVQFHVSEARRLNPLQGAETVY
jgi:hypothetical protein